MKSLIAIAVFVLASAGTGIAQTRDMGAAHDGMMQSHAAEAKSRTAHDQAENRITAQLNRQQLSQVAASSASVRPQSVPQTATRPSGAAPF